MDTITAAELSKITGKTKVTILNTAKRENWPYKEITVRGGKVWGFFIEKLPEAHRLLINKERNGLAAETESKEIVTVIKKNGEAQTMLLNAPDNHTPDAPWRGTLEPATKAGKPIDLTPDQISFALAKYSILTHYTKTLAKSPHGNKASSRDQFVLAYNSGVFPKLFEKVGPVSWKTIEGWKNTMKRHNNDPFVLADRRGAVLRGNTSLTPEQEKILLSCALNPNKPLISESLRIARAKMATLGITATHSDSTYRRFIEKFQATKYHVWVQSREGDKALNDKCLYNIERDYNRIDVGDVLVADGHILNFEIINPWTGKPKRMVLLLWYDMKSSFPLGWEIMPTENTGCIASALRRAIMRLGKVPKAAYIDNGKAFSSRFFNGADIDHHEFQGLFERLGMGTIFAWPYHGQSKTIERFFGTFAELERMCPTYVGTSIENQPPRMNRGERLHRRVYEKIMGNNGITLEQAHRAVAAWFDEYATRPQTGHLAGATPLEVFMDGKGSGVDAAALRYLMLAHEIRTVYANGIRFMGRFFYDPALFGRRHPVRIRYDLQMLTSVLVEDINTGELICEARETEKAHPAASILGTDADRDHLSKMIEFKQGQKKEASFLARTFLEEEVLPEQVRLLESYGIGPDGKSPLAPLCKGGNGGEPAAVMPSEAALMIELEEKRAATAAIADESYGVLRRLDQMDNLDRYEALIELDVRGLLIAKEHRNFMQYFESTKAYERNRDLYEQKRAEAIIKWQVEAQCQK